jgi:hypothetical protein
VVLAGESDQRCPSVALDAGRVDDGEATGFESLAGDVAQHVEGGRRGGLVVLVVSDEEAAEVR